MRDSEFYFRQLAEAMRGAREGRRMKLKEVAESLRYRSLSYLSEVEQGKRPASLALTRAYDALFQLDGYLIGLHGDWAAAQALERGRGPEPVRVESPPLPGDASEFIRESPDGVEVFSGEEFTKTWTVLNAGTATWDGRRLERTGRIRGRELPPSASSVPIPTTAPGELVTLEVVFGCAEAPGTRLVRFKMVDASGVRCFPAIGFGLSVEVTSRAGYRPE